MRLIILIEFICCISKYILNKMAEGGGPACREGQQPAPQQVVQQELHMNWSHFKPEFSGKPDEDVEAHLLRTNDWMTTHDFPEAVKVQRFCLTLVGEARNWYATSEPLAMTWPELQNMFRHQYSKIGNTREQLFHAWISFHYDENVETLDAYVIRIKQVARLLGYEDLQVLEVFKNTVPNRLYWVLFSIDNLHNAVETAKRFLTKEKIDRQMTGQSSTPVMKLTDKKRKSVTFDARDALEKTSEIMKRMTVLMDKMYIKLEKKLCLISPRYIKEVEDRIGDSLVKEIIGEVIGLSGDIAMNVTEDMDAVKVIFREAIFEEVIFKVDIIIEWIEVGKIGEHGDNLGQEKEKEEVGYHLVLDWDQELVQIEIGLGVLNVENMTTL